MKNIIVILGYVNHLRRLLLTLAGLSLITAAVGAAQPYGFKLIIDELVKTASSHGGNTRIIWLALLGLFALQVVNYIGHYFINLLGNRTYTLVALSLRDTIFRRLTVLSIDYFEKTRTGEIMQRGGNSVSEIAGWLYRSVSNILVQLLSLIFALVLIFITDWRAGLLASIAIATFFAMRLPLIKRTRPLGMKGRKYLERASGYLQETISHISTVRSFGGETGAVANHFAAISDWRKIQYKRTVLIENNGLIGQILTAIAVVGCMGIVADGAIRGTHTAGDILLVALYIQQIFNRIWPVAGFIMETSEIDITSERIVEMLSTKPSVIDADDATELKAINTIEFKVVSFAYPGKKTLVLDSLSFKIKPGQTFALVGKSGVGKTTITKLLLRFYEATDGQILINGEPIQNFTQESVRQHIGVVMQDVALFNDTIEANLHLANPKTKKSNIKTAAAQAHADMFIEKLPEKYKTLVGERGIKLSGGEKQRVAIARAILKNPQLIILDEATSALDSQSEQHVQAGLKELMSGRTAIVIAHRLSTVMKADQILVLENGRVAEQGTHSELLAKSSGLYAMLFRLQSGSLIAR